MSGSDTYRDPMSAEVEQVYRYPHPSRVAERNGRPELHLATSGGGSALVPADHPRFFDGFLGEAEQMAAALLVVARVARTRFYLPPGMVAAILRAADPVVTSDGERLRFESFSACCGAHARLDVLPTALDGSAPATGTTNVDFNPPMRQALAGLRGLDPLHLAVGEDVTVTTLDESVTERRVPLPTRWLKGFAEVQLAAAAMRPVLDVPAVEARRFVASLPATTGRTGRFWAVPAGRGLRLSGQPGRDAVHLAGPERLRVLAPLLRFGLRLRAYAPALVEAGEPTASVWELDLRGARLAVTLSPEVRRGFSGEGAVLRDLADPRSAKDAELVAALLGYEPRIDVADLSRRAGIGAERVLRALGRLGAAGRVGFDVHEGAWFHRELPYDAALLTALHPRLRDAQVLVEAGAVRFVEGVALVLSGELEHVVRRGPDGYRCSCPWYGRHRDSRGPCKHVLAVEAVERG
jgi:hypothetical protein